MNLHELIAVLRADPESALAAILPDGRALPAHFHVTEVGHVAKRFVDCGGTFRATENCVLQAWTGRDQDDGHRLTAGKLAGILAKAGPVLGTTDLPVEIEYEAGAISQYPLESIEKGAATLTLRLGSKHTDCLAKELCGVPAEASAPTGESCCGGSGCCG